MRECLSVYAPLILIVLVVIIAAIFLGVDIATRTGLTN